MKLRIIIAMIFVSASVLPSFALAENLLGLIYNDQGFTVQFADGCVTKDAVKILRDKSIPVQLTLVPYHRQSPCKPAPNGTQISYTYSEIGSGPDLIITNPVKPGVMSAH